MTKKDYVAIAATIRDQVRVALNVHEPEVARGMLILASALIVPLARDNPRFDHERFLAACEPN